MYAPQEVGPEFGHQPALSRCEKHFLHIFTFFQMKKMKTVWKKKKSWKQQISILTSWSKYATLFDKTDIGFILGQIQQRTSLYPYRELLYTLTGLVLKTGLNFWLIRVGLNVLVVLFFLLVSHLRLGQWMDDAAESWLKPFYCHYTLPAATYWPIYHLLIFVSLVEVK